MKKYITPAIKTVVINCTTILGGSLNDNLNDSYGGGTQLSKERDDMFEEEPTW